MTYKVTFKCKMSKNMNRGTRERIFHGATSHLTIRNFADVNHLKVVNVEAVQ